MQRWTRDEELEMTKMIKSGVVIDEIAKKYNRDSQSIELRLKKIIYENVMNGKDFKIISVALNLPENTVTNYYNSYKEFKDAHQIEAIEQPSKTSFVNNGTHKDYNEKKLESKIDKLERENKFIKLMLENKELHGKLNEQIKNNKIDKSVKDIITQMRKI